MIKVKKILIIVVIIILAPTFLYAEKKEEEKDCKYCLQYEKLLDWPEEDRPAIFVYQEDIAYPKGMFGMEGKMKAAGLKVSNRFVKKKNKLGKAPGPMIMDMGYFEVLFNELLNIPTTEVEKIEKLLKVRNAFRQSLNISLTAPSEEAIIKFYSLGKMMRSAKKKKKKIDPELVVRKKALEELKNKISLAKKAAKVSQTAKKIEEIKSQ